MKRLRLRHEQSNHNVAESNLNHAISDAVDAARSLRMTESELIREVKYKWFCKSKKLIVLNFGGPQLQYNPSAGP